MLLFIFFLASIPVIPAQMSAYKIEPMKHPMEDPFNKPSQPIIGPTGMPYNKTTDCETFGKYARFNPHSVVGIKWFVFYYWAKHQRLRIYKFWIPTSREMKILHYVMDGRLPKHFNWSATLVLRQELISNRTKLLEEKGDRGQYMAYSVYKGIPKGNITDFKRIRIKQTGDNKYLGILDCKKHTAQIMSHLDAVPPQHKLQEEASKLGVRGRKGKSYLYQGHEWMPIPEEDEREFWYHNRALLNLK